MIKQIACGMLILLCSCTARNGNDQAAPKEPAFRVTAYPSGQGWGYSIFINNKEYIRQPYIPVIEGDRPFASEQQAKTVAEYVVDKLKRHNGPALRRAELVQLKVVSPAAPGQPE